jgi:hypothetical protein
MEQSRYTLETGAGIEHEHGGVDIGPARGLTDEQKAIALECYATGNGAPKKVQEYAMICHL